MFRSMFFNVDHTRKRRDYKYLRSLIRSTDADEERNQIDDYDSDEEHEEDRPKVPIRDDGPVDYFNSSSISQAQKQEQQERILHKLREKNAEFLKREKAKWLKSMAAVQNLAQNAHAYTYSKTSDKPALKKSLKSLEVSNISWKEPLADLFRTMSPLRSTRSSRKGRSNEESSGSKFSMESKLSVNKSERKRFHKKKSKPVNPEQEWYDWFGEIQQRIYPEEQNKEKIKNVRITDVLLDIERDDSATCDICNKKSTICSKDAAVDKRIKSEGESLQPEPATKSRLPITTPAPDMASTAASASYSFARKTFQRSLAKVVRPPVQEVSFKVDDIPLIALYPLPLIK